MLSLSTLGLIEIAFASTSMLLTWLLWSKIATSKSRPPGPRATNWVTGNLTQVPPSHSWLTFTDWSNKFGDIVYFRMLHQHIIVLNTVDVANELLDKRSGLYSGRMSVPVIELAEWQWITAFMPYEDEWRAHRRLFQHYFNPEVSKTYEEVHARKIHGFLRTLLASPEDFFHHIRHTTGAIIMSVMYDHDVAEKNDSLMETAEAGVTDLARIASPGAFLVNVLPILNLVPTWFPGASWKKICQQSSIIARKMLHDPANMVRERMISGKLKPCIMAEILDRYDSSPKDLQNSLEMCATAYVAGVDTSAAALEAFFYAMVNFQQVQRKAQEEIDRVIGKDRLPTFEDRPSLPYVEATCLELLRWASVLPISIPHYIADGDIFRDYHIPKGTMVIPNVWAMTRDVNRYKDPERFDPSRFLDGDSVLNNDDVAYLFGFGRRLCPGRHFGFSTVWLTVATVLSTFSIRNAKDASGRDIPLNSGFGGEMMRHPLPFKCAITPRSEGAKRLIEDTVSLLD